MSTVASLTHSLAVEYFGCFQVVAVIKNCYSGHPPNVLCHLSEDSVCCTPAAEEPLSLIRIVRPVIQLCGRTVE